MEQSNARRSGKGIRYALVALALLGAVLLALFVFPGRSKYVSRRESFGNVEFTNQLAEKFELYQHKAERVPLAEGSTDLLDGTYRLNYVASDPMKADTLTFANTYEFGLLPATRLPCDPFLYITGKTKIPAYLYVELVESDQLKALTQETGLKANTVDGVTVVTVGSDNVYTLPSSYTADYQRFQVTVSDNVTNNPASLTRPVGAEDWEEVAAGKYTFTVSKNKTFSLTVSDAYNCVFSTLPRVSYQISDKFLPLMNGENQVVGPNGGKVYVYKNNAAATKSDDAKPVDNATSGINTTPIYILAGSDRGHGTENGCLNVDDKVPITQVTDVKLSAYGYLLQRRQYDDAGTLKDNTALQEWNAGQWPPSG